MESVKEKFLRYISFDTQSDPESESQPSTAKQLALSMQLVQELHDMGITDAALDKDGYVMASIPSNIKREVPAIGFIAHVDTAPDAPGKDIKPQIVENYDGRDILLNKEMDLYLRVKDFPKCFSTKGRHL